jgi:hypothetical protein
MKLLVLSIVLLVSLIPTSSRSEDVANCGASEGYGYYPSIGLTANRAAEWTKDGIANGRLTLKKLPTGLFDVLFIDATGSVVSSTQDGAKVILIGKDTNTISILVIYDQLIETFTFMHSTSGAEVMWTQNKHSTPIVKATVFQAKCSFVNIPTE